MRRFWLFLSLILLVLPTMVTAQAENPPIAAITDGSVWIYYPNGQGLRLTSLSLAGEYSLPAWSPDGRLLTFVQRTSDGIYKLLGFDFSGRPVVELASGISTFVPVSFTPESGEIIYATADTLAVYRDPLRAGAAPTQIANLGFTPDCTSRGRMLPTDQQLLRERANTPGGESGLLAMTPFGLLYRSRCNRPDLFIINLQNGIAAPLFPQASGVFASPDLTRAVVTQDNLVAFVQTERGPYTQISVPARPDWVGFAGAGEIVYSTRERIGETPLPGDSRAKLEQIFFSMPVNYRVSIHHFSLRTGIDKVLYEADAYGIGELILAPDGNTLIFSQVPNADAWVQAVAEGNSEFDAIMNAADATMQIEVYALNITDKQQRLLGTGWEQIALNPVSSAWANFWPSPPTPTPIPSETPTPAPTATPADVGLAVGVSARVSANGLNMREAPGTAQNVVAVLFTGDRVSIIDGPQDADGYRWWKIRLMDEREGWIVSEISGRQTIQAQG